VESGRKQNKRKQNKLGHKIKEELLGRQKGKGKEGRRRRHKIVMVVNMTKVHYINLWGVMIKLLTVDNICQYVNQLKIDKNK
jgi:hypothetical protein